MFTPKIGEDEPILTSIFFRWVETTNQIMMRFVTDRSERTPWWYNSIEIVVCCWRGCLTGWVLGKLGHIDVDWNRFFSRDYHHHSLVFLQPDILPNLGCWRIAASPTIMEVEKCFIVIVESKLLRRNAHFFIEPWLWTERYCGVVWGWYSKNKWKPMKTLLGIFVIHDQKCLLKIENNEFECGPRSRFSTWREGKILTDNFHFFFETTGLRMKVF